MAKIWNMFKFKKLLNDECAYDRKSRKKELNKSVRKNDYGSAKGGYRKTTKRFNSMS